jgi:uncharacterized protein (TIGR02246 family)
VSEQIQAEAAVARLYRQVMDGWNMRDAQAIAAAFADDADLVGFDGTHMHGKDNIARAQADIFAHHETGRWVGRVTSVRSPAADVAIAQAITGWVPPGADAPNPATNALQFLVAVRAPETWLLTLLQTTPAQFHGRPHDAAALAAELGILARGGA